MIVQETATTGERPTTLGKLRRNMIRLTVREVAVKAGINNPKELQNETGLPYETCRRVWNDLASQIGLGTIEALCDALKVQPGQLFEYEATKTKSSRRNRGGAK